jgi:hypothetical protein
MNTHAERVIGEGWVPQEHSSSVKKILVKIKLRGK